MRPGHNHVSLHIKDANQAREAQRSLLDALNAKAAVKEQINYSPSCQSLSRLRLIYFFLLAHSGEYYIICWVSLGLPNLCVLIKLIYCTINILRTHILVSYIKDDLWLIIRRLSNLLCYEDQLVETADIEIVCNQLATMSLQVRGTDVKILQYDSVIKFPE